MTQQKRNSYIKAISLFCVLSLVFGISSLVYKNQLDSYKQRARLSEETALNELCESLDNITLNLQKCMYTGTNDKLGEYASELKSETAIAKINLANVTNETIVTDEIYKFLSQIGEYTYAISKAQKLSQSKENAQKLAKLYEYSDLLSSSLSDILSAYTEGEISTEKTISTLSSLKQKLPDDFYSKLTDIQQSLTDYPTLIYDGPFSDDILNIKGFEMLKTLNEITRKEALQIASKALKVKESSLKTEEDSISDIELYCFSSGDSSIAITKKGGLICYILNPYFALEQTISEKEAVQRAEKYLKALGYTELEQTYYSIYDGICTINFAHCKNDIIHYSDLIKMSIALDNGEVTSFDSTTYLKNHRVRDIYTENITLEQASALVSENLEIIDCKSVIIPLQSSKESYCYEFHCKDKNETEVLVYIDKETGKEQNILLLLYADGGVLTK